MWKQTLLIRLPCINKDLICKCMGLLAGKGRTGNKAGKSQERSRSSVQESAKINKYEKTINCKIALF